MKTTPRNRSAGAPRFRGDPGSWIVVDLGYGDAGKGTVVDWLCATRSHGRPAAVVRFNGGCQAAHHVVTPDGRLHRFSQFGSGTLHGVPTHLSRFMLVEPIRLAAEAERLAALGVPDPLGLLTVDRDALLTTALHSAANRARERARGDGRHGSCGMGIGETMAHWLAEPDDAPRVADCASPDVLRRKLGVLRDRLVAELGPLDTPPLDAQVDAYAAFAERVRLVDGSYLPGVLGSGAVVFEGAQGVLLDEWHGFHPYTTWSTTTFANAETLLAEAGQEAQRIGVVRAYTTRHGPGPFPTEDRSLDLPDAHNGTNAWQGGFRVGHFDAVAHRYAVDACGGVDALAVTHLDRVTPQLKMCTAYENAVLEPADRDRAHQEKLTALAADAVPSYSDVADWPGAISDALGAPVEIMSFGPSWTDKISAGSGSS